MKKNRKEERGVLTLDFIFSTLAIYGISMVFGVLSLTLMFSEVAQYVSFASSRAHISGHVTQNEQLLMATKKFDQLDGLFNPFLSSSSQSWTSVEMRGVTSGEDLGSDRQKKYGVVLGFSSNLIKKMRLPLIGSPSDGGAGPSLGTGVLKSYLYREPSSEECIEFNKERWEALIGKFPGLGSMNINMGIKYGEQADNGC